LCSKGIETLKTLQKLAELFPLRLFFVQNKAFNGDLRSSVQAVADAIMKRVEGVV
jgi:hypothetical protein